MKHILQIESIYTSRTYYRNLCKSDVQCYRIIYRVTFRFTLYRFISTFRLRKFPAANKDCFPLSNKLLLIEILSDKKKPWKLHAKFYPGPGNYTENG